jgi:hypothetical protein
MVNAMSAMSSSFTILFLFWTITAFARKMVDKVLTTGAMYAVLGSGLVGALAYTFTDSFWFSAVEGEVYAMSSFFTAIVFWAILKWERETDESPHANRWIILIAYLMGLSIGVHLLNLLAIPAIVFIYYFKKYETTREGFIKTGILAIAILGGIQGGLIPMIVKIAAKFELFFVNTMSLPYNSGIFIYMIVLIAAIVYGLRHTQRNDKPILNTVILCFTVLLIGYSSFMVIVIRSKANPPMDENNPENAINLLSYLNREQYGTWPVGYGQYFSAPLDAKEPYKDGSPVYVEDREAGTYVISDHRKGSIPNYDKQFCTPFPRLWSSQQRHINGYLNWLGLNSVTEFKQIKARNPQTGQIESFAKPSFGQNLQFYFQYQIGHMYMRYFLWNFAGRQNDTQGHGNVSEGNWLTGITFFDEWRLGPQEGLPDGLDNNKAKNKFYALPLILGLIGMFFHIKKDNKNATVVGLLFIFTGIAIITYLNQKPFEPRERDYAFAASFYAFAIWIGIGVLAIYEALRGKMADNMNAIVTTCLCLVAVPTIMAKEGWDDHDRSTRYIARDFAANYLNSCAPNAILFTNGDNDTFPLWYAQEVEGIRTDVRVICLELLNTDWYIDQMVRRAYESAPVPFSFTKKQYQQGTRDVVLFRDFRNTKIQGFIPVKDLIDFVKVETADHRVQISEDNYYSFFPTRNMRVPVNKTAVLANGTVAMKDSARILDNIDWTISGSYVQKNDLMIIDLLAHNNWERPIYFAATAGANSYLNLAPYLQLEGLAYRLVPIKKNDTIEQQETRIATDIMYDNVMNNFAWGGMEVPGTFLDYVFLRSCAVNTRQRLGQLATELIVQGDTEKAIKVLDKVIEVTPEENVPYDATMYSIVMAYYQAGAYEKANVLADKLFTTCEINLNYYYALDPTKRSSFGPEIRQSQSILERMEYFIGAQFNQTEISDQFKERYAALLAKNNMQRLR